MKAKRVPDAQNKHRVLDIDFICLRAAVWDPEQTESRVSAFDRHTRPQTLTHACWHRWRTGMKSPNSLFVFPVRLRSSDRLFFLHIWWTSRFQAKTLRQCCCKQSERNHMWLHQKPWGSAGRVLLETPMSESSWRDLSDSSTLQRSDWNLSNV